MIPTDGDATQAAPDSRPTWWGAAGWLVATIAPTTVRATTGPRKRRARRARPLRRAGAGRDVSLIVRHRAPAGPRGTPGKSPGSGPGCPKGQPEGQTRR